MTKIVAGAYEGIGKGLTGNRQNRQREMPKDNHKYRR